MRESEILDLIGGTCLTVLRQHGFGRTVPDNLSRARNGSDQIFSFGATRDKTGTYNLVTGVGIRSAAIEAIIRPDRESERIVTVGVPGHFLKPGRLFEFRYFKSKQELEYLLPGLVSDLQAYALPFFELFPDWPSVVASLKSESASDWFTATSDYRDVLLVADTLVNGGRAEALKLGRGFLAKNQDKMPKYSKQLRELVGRIEASQTGQDWYDPAR